MASVIPVNNFSFETLPGGGLTNAGCGTGCSFSTGPIPGWLGSDGTSGQFQPGTNVGNNSWFSALSDGITIAYSNSATITQTVGPTVLLGDTYTFMIDLGRRNDQLFTASADLLINGNHIVAIGVTPTPGHFSTFTATYTGLVADVGKAITIELLSGGAQADFDNVRLSDSSVPEPTGLALVGLGLIGLSLFSRRRRHS